MVAKRIVGFMDSARQIIFDTPGLSAQEVYRRASELAKRQGKNLSAAQNPQGSLVATLHKSHMQFGLKRQKIGRDYLFYPAKFALVSATPSVAAQAPDNDGCCMSLPSDVDKRLEALVSLGRFQSKGEAQQELITIGLDTLLAKLAS